MNETNPTPEPAEAEPVETSTALVKHGQPVSPPALAERAPTPTRGDQVNDFLLEAYKNVSKLAITDEEAVKLMARFPDTAVEVRPHDGLIFIPHIIISRRLNEVFGPGRWSMVRRREWVTGNQIYAEWVLVVRGAAIGDSVGAKDYYPNNPKMNYSDALEGTRGECIRRICGKELSCGDQVWDPEYARQWVNKYAVKVNNKWERRMDAVAPTEKPIQSVADTGTVMPAGAKPEFVWESEGETVVLWVTTEKVGEVPPGKKARRVSFREYSTVFFTMHKMEEVHPGDKITITVKKSDTQTKIFYFIEDWEPGWGGPANTASDHLPEDNVPF